MGLLHTGYPSPSNPSGAGTGEGAAGRPPGAYGPTCFGIAGPADALAADERVQRPGLLWPRSAAEARGAARSDHPAGSALWQGAQRAAAAAGGWGGLSARVGYRRAKRELLRGAGRAVPWLGGARRRARLDGQQEQKRPGAGSGELRHRGAGAADRGRCWRDLASERWPSSRCWRAADAGEAANAGCSRLRYSLGAARAL